jgi:hypothetical protein
VGASDEVLATLAEHLDSVLRAPVLEVEGQPLKRDLCPVREQPARSSAMSDRGVTKDLDGDVLGELSQLLIVNVDVHAWEPIPE